MVVFLHAIAVTLAVEMMVVVVLLGLSVASLMVPARMSVVASR